MSALTPKIIRYHLERGRPGILFRQASHRDSENIDEEHKMAIYGINPGDRGRRIRPVSLTSQGLSRHCGHITLRGSADTRKVKHTGSQN